MKPALVLLAAAAAALPLAACVAPGYGQYGGYGSPGYSPYGNDRYDDRYDDRYQGNTFRCESTDHRVRRCPVDTRAGVRLVRQESDAPCVQGQTWGYDRDGVWVSNGCRARFELGGGGYGYTPPGYGQGQSQVVRCESQDERRVVCGLPFRARGVQIRRQLSDTRCSQNYNWGWRADSIWVDRGCRAEFVATS